MLGTQRVDERWQCVPRLRVRQVQQDRVTCASRSSRRVSMNDLSHDRCRGHTSPVGTASSTVAITVGDGSSHEVEFRGEEKARHAHDMILHYVIHS
jgi:hypothetical protein